MVLYGTVHRVGDGITCNQIIGPEHRAAGDPALLAAYCLSQVDPAIAEQAREGDVLVAGRGLGMGPEPEIAVLALQAAGFAAVVCISGHPDFVQTAESYGLPVLVCPEAAAEIAAGSVVRLDLASGRITDRASGVDYQAPPCAPALVELVRRAQLLGRMRRAVEEEGFDG
jgi:3-isopropylmalate/(R)-2-methylmalate dehydratase small subunit